MEGFKKDRYQNVENRKKGVSWVVVVLVIVLFVAWELFVRTEILYDEALVLKENIAKGTVVTEEMVTSKKLQGLPNGAIKPSDLNDIIGKETIQFVASDTFLLSEYFISKEISPVESNGLKNFAIPENWMESYPETIRRGDMIYLYAIGASDIEKAVVSAKVAHVKDSSNNEISAGGNERKDASNNVSSIEVVLEEAEIIRLTKLVEGGTKFLVSYQQ